MTTSDMQSVRQRVDAFLEIEPSDRLRLLQDAAEQAERGEDEISMLERAAKLSYRDFDAAWRMLDNTPDSGQFMFLHTAVLALIWSNRPIPPTEAHIRAAFYDRLSEYLPGAVQIKFQCIKGAIPDGMIAWNSREMPVEVKKGAFDVKARDQLRRYMEAYDSEHGIAVAPSIGCDLPDDMTFVPVQAPKAPAGPGDDRA